MDSTEKPTMKEILRQSGFEWLTEKSDTETVYHFLAKFKTLSHGFDPAHVELVKGEIRKKLKDISSQFGKT